MSGGKIDVDLPGIKTQLNTYAYVVGDLEGALKGFPAAVDAGEASGEVGAIVSALKSTSDYIVGVEKGLDELAMCQRCMTFPEACRRSLTRLMMLLESWAYFLTTSAIFGRGNRWNHVVSWRNNTLR